MNRRTAYRGLFLAMLLCGSAPVPGQDRLSGYVFVQDDGSLRLQGRTVHLFGIYIPPTAEDCFTFVRPPLCGPRAAINLEFRIGNDWVYCDITQRSARGLTGRCRVDDDDLSAWMLEQGWALALPDAPFEYRALEKIARSQGRGVWGIAGRPVR